MRLSRVRLTIRSMMLVLIGVALLHRRGCPRRTVRRRPTVAALEAIPPPGAAPPRGVALVLPGDGVLAPVAAHRLRGGPGRGSMAATCYFYGTPLMAVFVTTSLLAGGWIRPRRGRRRPGREVFGLLVALAWACTGLYILSETVP